MLTNFFGKSKPITFLVIFVLFLFLFLLAVFNGKTTNHYENILLFLLLFAVVIFINIKNNLSFDNFYVFLIFTLLIGAFPCTHKIDVNFYNNFILLLFLRKIYSLQSSIKTLKKLFDAGLWLGISFILEPFSVIFGILIYLSVYLHQHLNFKKIIAPIIGFVLPVFFFFTYSFWFDKSELFFNLFDWFTYYDIDFYQKNQFIIPSSIFLFFTLLGILIKTSKALAVKNDFRKNWILILFNFICALILIILIKERNGSEFLYLFFPVAIIIANLIEIYQEKWFSNIFIIFLLFLSVTMCIV